MDKAMAAQAEGKYVEAEAYAKRVMEIDPGEVTAPILAFKARMERRFKAEGQIRDAKENGVADTLLAIDRAAIPGPGSSPSGPSSTPATSRTSPATASS